MMERLDYEIALDPTAHEFVVTLTLAAPVDGGMMMSLPAWIPGSYMVRDFARNITEIAASDAEAPVELIKRDKQTWVLGPNGGPVTIRYRVYAFDLSVRSAYLDDRRGYFNGTSLGVVRCSNERAHRIPVTGAPLTAGVQAVTLTVDRTYRPEGDERRLGCIVGRLELRTVEEEND